MYHKARKNLKPMMAEDPAEKAVATSPASESTKNMVFPNLSLARTSLMRRMASTGPQMTHFANLLTLV